MEFGCNDMTWFGDILDKFENICGDIDDVVNYQEPLKFIGSQLLALGDHVKEFWSNIVQNNETIDVVDAQNNEVFNLSNSQAVTDLDKIVNRIPSPDHEYLPRDSSLELNTVVRMFGKSSTDDNGSCEEVVEFSSQGSIEIITNSSIDGETNKPADVNTEVSRDPLTISSDVSDRYYESQFSDCDDDVSMESTGNSDVTSTEDVWDHEHEHDIALLLTVHPAAYATSLEVIDHHHEQGLETAKSQLPNVKLDEGFTLISDHKIASVRDLTKHIGDSKMKFVEMKALEHLEDLRQIEPEGERHISSLPNLDSVYLSDEFCEADWVVV